MAKLFVTEELSIQNARIKFRNFSGKEAKYNAAGKRVFSVVLPTEYATRLEEDGWNIRWYDPDPEDDPSDPGEARIKVEIRFENRPPKIVQITSRGQTRLDETTVGMLDYADFKNVDVVIRPYNWEVNGKSGVKAYLKELYVTIEESVFAEKYADVPMIDEDRYRP